MTIKELIEKLKEYPENMRVILDGYEGGYEDIKIIRTLPIQFNVNSADWDGPHDSCKEDEKDETAIHIGR